MTANIGQARIDVVTDDSQVRKLGEKSGGVFGKGFAAVAGLAVGAVFAVRGLSKFTGEVRAAGEDAVVDAARIQQVAESMGLVDKGATALTDRLLDTSGAFSKLTGIEDNTIQKAQGLLLTFGNVASSANDVGGVFDRATVAAADLAAAGFGEIEGNASSLGIALNDPIAGLGRLTRVGVTFTAAQKEQITALVQSGDLLEAQGILLGAIESQVGGVAAATAKTSERVKTSWGEVQESIGVKLMPVFERFGNFLIDTVHPQIEKFVGGAADLITKLVDAFDEAESIPEGLLNAFEVLTGGEGMGAIFGKVTEIVQKVFTDLVDWLASGGIGQILQSLISSRQRLFDAALKLFPAIIDALLTILPILLDTIANQVLPQIIEFIRTGIPLLLETAVSLFDQLIQAVITILPDLIEVLLGTVLPSLLETVLGMIPDLLETAVTLFTSLLDAVVEILPDLLTLLLGTVLPNLVVTIIGMVPEILKAAITAFLALVRALLKVLPELIRTLLGEVLPELLATIIEMAPEILLAAIDMFFELVAALVEIIPELVTTIVTEVIPAIFDAFMQLGPKLYEAGKNAITKLWDGIKEIAGKVIKWVEDNVVGRIANLWPFSPAKEGPLRRFPPELAGENLMKLYAKGIMKGAGAATDAAAGAAGFAAQGLGGAGLALAGGGSFSLAPGAIQISISGTVSDADARRAGELAGEAAVEKLTRARLVR